MKTNNIYNIVKVKSDDINKYKNKNSLYNIINKNGYRVFSISKETTDLIKNYYIKKNTNDIKTSSDAIKKYLLHKTKGGLPGVVESYRGKFPTYGNTRYHSTFYNYERMKEKCGVDSKLTIIAGKIKQEIQQIGDLKDWEMDLDTITLNFLISYCNKLLLKNDEFGTTQDFHTDYKYLSDDDEHKNNNYPLSIIVAFQNETYFRFLCKSHLKFLPNGYPNPDEIYHEKLLELNEGQFIIFHPNLIHSGYYN